MKETLAPGIEHEATFTVTPDMSPPHLPVLRMLGAKYPKSEENSPKNGGGR